MLNLLKNLKETCAQQRIAVYVSHSVATNSYARPFCVKKIKNELHIKN